MNVLDRIEDLSGLPGPLHLAIGVFDGVHLGHQAVLDSARSASSADSGVSVMITFEPHPAQVLRPEQAPLLLTHLRHKLRLVEAQGIDHALVVPFTPEFSQTTALQFVENLQKGGAEIRSVSVGQDWRFGRNRSGDLTELCRIGEVHGFQVHGIPPLSLEDHPVSSTTIRQLLIAGNLDETARYLGRPFSLLGRVDRGKQLGRQLGFPTANLSIPGQLLPPLGVYAGKARNGQSWRPSVINLGRRPTVDAPGERIHLEAHLLDYDGPDFYGEDLEVQFLSLLRGEEKFDSLDLLQAQIQRDILAARKFLSH